MAKSEIEKVKTGLPLDEDIKLHQTGWTVQRIGWGFLFLFLLLAVLGFFGDGVISKKKIEFTGAKIEFDQYFRREARMELKMELNPLNRPETVIAFSNDYLKKMRIESIVPQPKENKVENGMTHYIFNGKDDLTITYYLIPQKMGSISGNIFVNNNQFTINQFIYP